MTVDEYLQDRIEHQIKWYDRRSMRNQRWFNRLRMGEIIAAAAIPVLSGLVAIERPWVIPAMAILGGLVAIVAGLLGLYQFEHPWVDYRTTCESLKKEKYLFVTGAEPYDQDAADNFETFVQRIEALVSKENMNWAQYMMKPNKRWKRHRS